MYHENPEIDDIVLTVINDGDGELCGMDYNKRCQMAFLFDATEFIVACKQYNSQKENQVSDHHCRTAAFIVRDYYRNHLKENERYLNKVRKNA